MLNFVLKSRGAASQSRWLVASCFKFSIIHTSCSAHTQLIFQYGFRRQGQHVSPRTLSILMFPLQWHPEAEAKVSHNLRLKDEEAAEALAASVQALQQLGSQECHLLCIPDQLLKDTLMCSNRWHAHSSQYAHFLQEGNTP